VNYEFHGEIVGFLVFMPLENSFFSEKLRIFMTETLEYREHHPRRGPAHSSFFFRPMFPFIHHNFGEENSKRKNCGKILQGTSSAPSSILQRGLVPPSQLAAVNAASKARPLNRVPENQNSIH
jgi:hypothetical protein